VIEGESQHFDGAAWIETPMPRGRGSQQTVSQHFDVLRGLKRRVGPCRFGSRPLGRRTSIGKMTVFDRLRAREGNTPKVYRVLKSQ
jgi:hypothetical protein